MIVPVIEELRKLAVGDPLRIVPEDSDAQRKLTEHLDRLLRNEWWVASSSPSFSTLGADIGTGSRKYSDIVTCRNGRSVLVPYDADRIRVFIHADDTINNSIGGPVGSAKWSQGVLLRSGRVCFVPYSHTYIGRFDPVEGIFYEISGPSTSSGKYQAGCLLPDGRTLFAPWNNLDIGLLGADESSFSSISIPNSNLGKFTEATLAPSGLVYLTPFSTDRIGVFDYRNDSYREIPLPVNDPGYYGAVLATNGRIYMIPGDTDTGNFGVLDTRTEEFREISVGAATDNALFRSAVLGSDGRIYCIPHNSNVIGVLDPRTETYSTISGPGADTLKYRRGCSLPDGRILMAGYDTDDIGQISGLAAYGDSRIPTYPLTS